MARKCSDKHAVILGKAYGGDALAFNLLKYSILILIYVYKDTQYF